MIGWGTGEVSAQVLSSDNTNGPMIAVDNAGRAYGTWSDLTTGAIDTSYFLFGLSPSWSTPLSLTTSAFVSSIFPDSIGNLYVALHDSLTNGVILETAYSATSNK